MEARPKFFSIYMENLIRQGYNDKIISYIKDMKLSELVDSHGTSLLHLAVGFHNCGLTKYLIDVKFNINAKDASETTPLIVAAKRRSFKEAELLIQADADIYAKNLWNESALPLLLNDSYVPKYLIERCLEKVKKDSSSDEEIADKLFVAECPFEYVVYLKNSDVTLTTMNRYGPYDPQKAWKALTLAIVQGDQENILGLLRFGVEINFRKIDVALFFAMIRRWEDEGEPCSTVILAVIAAFLERANWMSLRGKDLHCLESVFRQGSRKVVELFLRRNVNENVKSKFPQVDVMTSLFGNCNANTRELLRHRNVDVHSRNSNGQTALHMTVARENSLYDIQALLELGACPNLGDIYGSVPMAFVKSDGSSYMANLDSDERKRIELLLQAGADVQIYIQSHYEWYKSCSVTRLETIIAQFVIDESLEKPIEERIRQSIIGFRQTRKHRKKCNYNLEKSKATKVQGLITLYTILVTDPAIIARHLRNRKVVHAITQSSAQMPFFYVGKVEKSVTRILYHIGLREKATTFLCDVARWSDSQYIVIEKILGFLTSRDLHVFNYL